MKIKNYCSAILLLATCFTAPSEETRLLLRGNPFAPTIGEARERIITNFISVNVTNINGDRWVTNLTVGSELKLTEHFLVWDVTNDYAKVDATVEKMESVRNGATNSVAEPGTKVRGTYIAGEWLFEAYSGKLSPLASAVLSGSYAHPQTEDMALRLLKCDQPRSVGERWNINYYPPISDKLAEISRLSAGIVGRSLPGLVNTNDVAITAQLIGITNIAGVRYFDLEMKAGINKKVRGLTWSATNTADFFVPVEISQRSWIKSVSVESFLSLLNMDDKTNTPSYNGLSKLIAVEFCRKKAN